MINQYPHIVKPNRIDQSAAYLKIGQEIVNISTRELAANALKDGRITVAQYMDCAKLIQWGK
jgi:hypothetical protein